MVASSQPLAVEVGLDVLKFGGNAIDAAVTVDAMLGLVEPMSCGMGGDLFAIVWDAKSQKLHGLNASGRSPYRATIDWFHKNGHQSIPGRGPLAWSVPGCVDGWDRLLKRLGTRSLAEVLEPCIHHAENGFPVSPLIASYWQGALRLPDKDALDTYAPDGKVPKVGELFKNPRIAQTYRTLAKEGRDAFYYGDLAKKIVAASEAKGGLFILQDMEDHTSNWVDPVSTDYRGHTVWELPPNGQGIATLEILNILEGFDLSALGHNSVQHLHRFVEAKKLAYEDRAVYYADMAFNELPIQALISKPFADKQRARIDPGKAARQFEPGNPAWGQSDTVYLTVVDKDRNAVSLIQSIYAGFGSAVAPGDLGFNMQNRGALFALDEEHLNRLQPHKRPFHTIIPAMVTKDGKPWFSYGVMGGDMQPQGQVQVLCNMLDFGMNVQEAGVVPRCRHNGSSRPTGSIMADGGKVHLEEGIPSEVSDGIAALGHTLAGPNTSYGGYQGIRIDFETGLLYGGSEPRKDGMALGY